MAPVIGDSLWTLQRGGPAPTPELTTVLETDERRVKLRKAEARYRRALACAESSLGPHAALTICAAGDLASCLMESKSGDQWAHESEKLVRRCLAHHKKDDDGDIPSLFTVAAARTLATLLERALKSESVEAARSALAAATAYSERGYYHPDHVEIIKSLARVLLADAKNEYEGDTEEKLVEARALLRRAALMEETMIAMEEEFKATMLSSVPVSIHGELVEEFRTTTLPVQLKSWFDLIDRNNEALNVDESHGGGVKVEGTKGMEAMEEQVLAAAIKMKAPLSKAKLNASRLSALRSTRAMLASALLASRNGSAKADGSEKAGVEASRIIGEMLDPLPREKVEDQVEATKKPPKSLMSSLLIPAGKIVSGGPSIFSTDLRAFLVALPVYLVVSSLRVIFHATTTQEMEGTGMVNDTAGSFSWYILFETAALATFAWGWGRGRKS